MTIREHLHHSPSRNPRRATRASLVALGLTVALGLAACDGGDDESRPAPGPTTTAAPEPEMVPAAAVEVADGFCDAVLATDAPAPPPGLPPEFLMGVYTQAASAFDELVALAPAAIEADARYLAEVTHDAAQTGARPPYFAAEYSAALRNVHEVVAEHCDFAQVDVEGVDFGFAGLPSTLPAGRTNFTFANVSDVEQHEMVLLRKGDGVTESFQEIMALPEDQMITKVLPVAVVLAGQSETAAVAADLAPGEYAAVCTIPVGGKWGEPGEPHAARGMFQEFTVG